MMIKKSPCAMALAMLLSWLVAMPCDSSAAPAGTGPRAGEVSRVIPAVNLARSGKTIPAAAKTVVNWQDLVNTQVSARARIARSEEHTSELQSRLHLVCRLLLEKKKKRSDSILSHNDKSIRCLTDRASDSK